MAIINYRLLYCIFASKKFIRGIPSCKFLAPPLVSKCIVFERVGSKGWKESNFLLFLHEEQKMGCSTRREDVVSM